MTTCEHVDSALIEQEREAWIARAIAAGMTEADARATAARMSFGTVEPARKRARKTAAPRKRATKSGTTAQPVQLLLEVDAPPARPARTDSDTLPSFSDELRAIPSHLARSPLFAPIRPGRRALRQDELLPSPQGVSIRYSGPQLDQADCDAFMQLIWEQRSAPVGAPVKIVRQMFLGAIGRADGGKNYAWLQATLERLQSARVKVENSRYVMTAQLLGKVIEDKLEATFHIVMDRDIVEMFAPSARSLVDWEKRLQIAVRVDLAKWLHNFTASHKDLQQYHSLENLRNWSGYSSPLRKFKEATAEALAELARLQIISEPEFYERRNPETKKKEQMVRWIRL
jgi:hypothetical protein